MSYAISRRILEAKGNIFAHEIAGERVFVKKKLLSKNPLGRLAQRILFAATGNILLLPPDSPRRAGADYEARTLRALAAKGINVPAVLHDEEDYFVMEDAGESLYEVLRDSPEGREDLAVRSIIELRRLHDLGFAHGGAQIKNMTVRDNVILFIDFEEAIPDRHLAAFQVRDLFLFLLSLERCGFDPDLPKLLAAYSGSEPDAKAMQLPPLLKKWKILNISNWRIFSKLKIRDIRALSSLVDKANAL